jgi:diguanylate cyclase (GGDEF)-like protein
MNERNLVRPPCDRRNDTDRTITLLEMFASCPKMTIMRRMRQVFQRYQNEFRFNAAVTFTGIMILTCVDFFLGSMLKVDVIYILVVVFAAIKLDRRMAVTAGLLSAASMFVVDLSVHNPSQSRLFPNGITVLLFLVASYFCGRLASATRRQVKRVAVLNQVARATGSTIEMDALLELTYQQLRQVIPTDTYYVGLHDPANKHIDLQIVYDEGKRYPPYRVNFGEGLASLVIQNRQPVLLRHLSKEAGTYATKMVVVGLAKASESWLGVPLLMNDEFSGVLVVASYKPHAFDDGDVDLLTDIAGQVALALDNARHHSQVEDQAHRDSLTGVLNHGYLLERLEREISCARAAGCPLSLIMLDIDYFKDYNDTYGHVMGDQVLRLTVQAIEAHVKRADAVGRWGGEEFGVILHEATSQQARSVADRIRETLVAMPMPGIGGEWIPNPTVSQGIATFPDQARSAQQLVDIADAMLYEAKNQGRDQVRVAQTFKP